MKNYWLKNKHIFKGPLCVAISCSRDLIPGACIWDLENCKTFEECLASAIKRSKELSVIGPADKIVLMTTSRDVIWSIVGNSSDHEKSNTILTWNKINDVWVGIQK